MIKKEKDYTTGCKIDVHLRDHMNLLPEDLSEVDVIAIPIFGNGHWSVAFVIYAYEVGNYKGVVGFS